MGSTSPHPPTLSWADGETGPKTITIAITDDALVETDETFDVSLTNITGASAGTITSSEVTILDNEVPGVINLADAAINVDEDAGNAVITLTRTGGSDGTATASITTTNGSATEGVDFAEPATVVTWTPGDSADKTISVPISDDTNLEPDEGFTVNLANVTVAATGSSTTTAVTIIDNDDVGVIDIAPATASVDEDGTSVTLTVTRSGGSDGAASVVVGTADDSATAGSDYTAINTTLDWTDGETGPKTVTLLISDDGLPESNETLTVALSGYVGAAAGTTTTSTVTIIDTEVPGVLDISPATVSVDENNTVVAVTVTRSGGSDGAASVEVATLRRHRSRFRRLHRRDHDPRLGRRRSWTQGREHSDRWRRTSGNRRDCSPSTLQPFGRRARHQHDQHGHHRRQ